MGRIDRVLRSYLRLRHLQLLVALDELRHLGKTAVLLGITQPAASKSLAEIESAFGVPLFRRSPAGTHPTLHGEAVLRFARSVLADLQRTRDELTALSEGSAGRVSIASMGLATPVLLSKSLALMKRKSPKTTVFADEGFFDGLLPRLRAGEFDFVVSRLEPRWAASDLGSSPLYSDPLLIVAGPDHPLAHHKKVSWEQLASEPWLVPQPGAPARLRLEQAFEERRLDMPTDRIEVTSFLALLTLIRERPAVALLTRSVARHFAKMGMVNPLPIKFPYRLPPVGIIALRGRDLSPGARLLIECLRQTARSIRTGSQV